VKVNMVIGVNNVSEVTASIDLIDPIDRQAPAGQNSKTQYTAERRKLPKKHVQSLAAGEPAGSSGALTSTTTTAAALLIILAADHC